ncbi:MAG TPA: neutral/alkaline non-lysosomal ceramidase N-terminal domain-containing protein [bacterium]|nr:neutral/alkaline non-lysosomal ceramidase N-terminal domain-containing protein [bacterium]
MSEKQNFRAGVAQVDITPPLGSDLGGYHHRRLAREIRSRLYTKAMVIESDGKRIALVANDICMLSDDITYPAKEKIASSCGIPAEAVMLSATHTHTGPAIDIVSGVPATGLPFSPDPVYIKKLTENIVKGVMEACSSLFDAGIFYGQAQAEGFSINKLCRLKNGRDIYDTRPMDGGRDGRIGFSGPLDNSVQVLCIKDTEKKVRAFAVNYACHPNSGPDVIWAEWPGEMAETISLVYGQDVPCLLLQGTSGDVDCMLNLPHERIGRGIAGAAIMAIEREQNPSTVLPIDFRMKNIPMQLLAKTPETERLMNEIKKKPDRSLPEESWLKRYNGWNPGCTEINVPIQCLRMGQTAFVGLPGEIFTSIGLEIKRYSPAANTMVVELANTRVGYVPPVEQADRGGYGQWPFTNRLLVPEAASIMADAAVGMLWEMWDVDKR